MLTRLYKMVRYNRDWARYVWSRYQPQAQDELLTFRLRNGQTITMKADTRFVLNEIYLDRVYDVPGFDFASCCSVLDIGANAGVFALYALSNAPAATVYCFEPQSENFAILERNIRSNNARIKAYRLAVAAATGMGYLSLDKTSAEYSLSTCGPRTEQVECVNLERVFELTGVDTFDLVKMDVEGVEREILEQCGSEVLSRIKALVVEWHHSWEQLEALAKRLRQMGFIAQPTLLHGHVRYLCARRTGRAGGTAA